MLRARWRTLGEAFGSNLFRIRANHVLANRAFEPGARGFVIVQRLDLRRARLRERSLGVEHIELRAGAGPGSRPGQSLRLLGFFLYFLV